MGRIKGEVDDLGRVKRETSAERRARRSKIKLKSSRSSSGSESRSRSRGRRSRDRAADAPRKMQLRQDARQIPAREPASLDEQNRVASVPSAPAVAAVKPAVVPPTGVAPSAATPGPKADDGEDPLDAYMISVQRQAIDDLNKTKKMKKGEPQIRRDLRP